MVSKRERRRLRRMNQERKDDIQKAQTPQHNESHPPEVFDSSKYDSMSDMVKSGSKDQLINRQAIVEVQKKEPLNPENIENKSISAANPSTEAKINPMIAEERARTIRETNEEVGQPRTNDMHEIETPQQSSYAISDWTAAMFRQYMEMANTGIELYAQFLKASIDFANSWFGAYRNRTE